MSYRQLCSKYYSIILDSAQKSLTFKALTSRHWPPNPRSMTNIKEGQFIRFSYQMCQFFTVCRRTASSNLLFGILCEKQLFQYRKAGCFVFVHRSTKIMTNWRKKIISKQNSLKGIGPIGKMHFYICETKTIK